MLVYYDSFKVISFLWYHHGFLIIIHLFVAGMIYIYIHTYIYISIYTYTYKCIYIYRERDKYVCMYVYIYIYTCVGIIIFFWWQLRRRRRAYASGPHRGPARTSSYKYTYLLFIMFNAFCYLLNIEVINVFIYCINVI